MTKFDNHPHVSDDVLIQATRQILETKPDDQLLERCLSNALRIELDVPAHRRTIPHAIPSWNLPLAIAATLFVLCNFLQAYTRQPSADRQFAATYRHNDSQVFHVFSDLRFEPAGSSFDTSRGNQK